MKDIVCGVKMIILSGKKRHSPSARTRFFFGGVLLCVITLYILYVSAIYNRAIATSDTAIIYNAVIILFIMEIDEKIFAAIHVINNGWIKRTIYPTEGQECDKFEDNEKGNGQWQSEWAEMKRELGELQEKVRVLEGPPIFSTRDTDG